MQPTPRVAVLAFDGVVGFDLATACHVFATAGGYDVAVCGEHPRPVDAGTYSLGPTAGLDCLAAADTVVVPGVERLAASAAQAPDGSRAAGAVLVPDGEPPAGRRRGAPGADTVLVPGAEPPAGRRRGAPGADTVPSPRPSPDVLPAPIATAGVTEALRAAAARGARVASICTGAFVLAEAGLLDGRRATTHWAYADRLRARFPAVVVTEDVLYVDEGEVLTSAGVAAGIDLCLHLVRADRGTAVANRVARRMVVPPHRDGGQAQYVQRPLPEPAGTSLAATRAWMLARLGEPLTVRCCAAHAHVSPRTFARRFRAETGTTPLRWLLHERVDAARRLLEETDLDVEGVAARAGFGTATGLRDHFRRATGTTPTAYRATFRGRAASA